MTRAPKPTRQEIAAWRRLLEEARACANNPARPTGDLYARAAKAHKAVFPSPPRDRSSPWHLLLGEVTAYCAHRLERPALAGALMRRVEACPVEALRPRLDTASPRFRADLDG